MSAPRDADRSPPITWQAQMSVFSLPRLIRNKVRGQVPEFTGTEAAFRGQSLSLREMDRWKIRVIL